ncbi:MAG: ABC transporter permease [bacterium]|nr:ABC transporter permease [bacterium]
MLYLILAWRNIWRNRKRTWITASSIGFAVFFAILMQSMQIGSYDRMIDNSVRFLTGHLSIHQVGFWEEQILDNGFEISSIDQLTFDDLEVEVAVPRIASFALASYLDKTKGVLINGVDPKKESLLTYLDKKVTKGSYLDKDGVIIGEGLADYLKIDIGDTIVFISQGYHGVNAAGKYVVKGFVSFPVPELNQSAVYMNIEEAQLFFGAPNILTSYNILLKDEADVPSLQSALSNQLEAQNLEVKDWQSMMPELLQGIELDKRSNLIMIVVLYVVIGFGIFGTFLMMTKERTYEFGILIAVGMRNLKIQLMVALEILILSFLGVIIGSIISLPLVTYFHFNPIELTGEVAKANESFGYEAILPVALEISIFNNQAIAILLMSAFLGIYPMLNIRNLVITKALKE